jgi:hypothetical protein
MILTRTITINGSTHASGGGLRDQAEWIYPRAFGIVSGIFEAETRVDGAAAKPDRGARRRRLGCEPTGPP